MAIWPVQDAKSRLGELIEQARTKGPQTITRQGAVAVIVLSIEDYRALVVERPNFVSHLVGGPKVESFDIVRDKDLGRTIEF